MPTNRADGADQFARDTLAQFEITSAKISSLRIKIHELTSPPTAKAEFMGTVRFEDRKGRIPYKHYPANVTVELQKDPGGDRWLVIDVQYVDIR